MGAFDLSGITVATFLFCSATFNGVWLFSPLPDCPPDVLPPRIVHCNAHATSMHEPLFVMLHHQVAIGGQTVCLP